MVFRTRGRVAIWGRSVGGRTGPETARAVASHLGVHVGQAIAAELVEKALALEAIQDERHQLWLGGACGAPRRRRRRWLWWGRRGRRWWRWRWLFGKGSGDGGDRGSSGESAATAGHDGGSVTLSSWLPSLDRGEAPPSLAQPSTPEAERLKAGRNHDDTAENATVLALRHLRRHVGLRLFRRGRSFAFHS